jgi:anti-sigma factor RsiW
MVTRWMMETMPGRSTGRKLAAFADGELEPEEAARVVMHLADHPEDQAYVDRIAVERALLARAYGPIAAEPVPERIRAVIEGREASGARVLAFPPRALAGLPRPGSPRRRRWCSRSIWVSRAHRGPTSTAISRRPSPSGPVADRKARSPRTRRAHQWRAGRARAGARR